MRFIYVAAATATLLMAPVVLVGASPAHADSGVINYAHCVGNGTQPPPPGVSPEDWFPSVHVMITDIDSGVPSAQVVQRLVNMGVNPDDAATRVRCFLATGPR